MLTSWTDAPQEQGGLVPYLNALGNLGSLCILETDLPRLGQARILVGQHQHWLDPLLADYFEGEVSQLALHEIQAFLDHLHAHVKKTHRIARCGARLRQWFLPRSKPQPLYRLETLSRHPEQHALVLAVIAQHLLERFNRRVSWLVPIDIAQQGERQAHWGLLLAPKKKQAPLRFWDPSGHYPKLHDIEVDTLSTTLPAPAGQPPVQLHIAPRRLRIMRPDTGEAADRNAVTLIAPTGKALNLVLQGRSAAEKRFRAQERQIAAAGPQEQVPLELCFHPYWFQFGHTTLRVGEALYEFTQHGWKKHHQGADKARGFLFNNPFARKQYAQYAADGMAPMSLGCELQLTRAALSRLEHYLEAEIAAESGPHTAFSLLRNNCNHAIMRAFEHLGLPGFSSAGYRGFSSVLSFRRTLLYPEVPITRIYAYPLPGVEADPEQVRRWMPKRLYTDNNILLELLRGWCLVPAKMARFHARRLYRQLRQRTQADAGACTALELMEH